MTSLREAAEAALKVMESADVDPHSSDAVYKAITDLRAALADGDNLSPGGPVQKHENWCASVTQLLLCDPPRKAPCNCKKKLAEPVQEPVAWWHRKSDTFTSGNLVSKFDEWTPLYPAPPQRKPLTDEKLDELAMDEDGLPNSHIEFARAIERAHGIGEKA